MSDSRKRYSRTPIIGMGVVFGAALGLAFSPFIARQLADSGAGPGPGMGATLALAVFGGAVLGGLLSWVVTWSKR